ncbi:MAG: hypothetical protein AAGA22_01150 [Pseudomonadota bacterium]
MTKKPDQFSNHEAVDRTCLIAELFAERVLDHPSIQLDKDLRAKANQISAELYELYAMVGRKYL